MGLFLFGGIDTEQSESYWLTQMTTKPHIIIQRYYVFSFERLNQTRPSKQCRFCDYLLDLSLISQDCQSCWIGQSGRAGAGCPNCPGGPGCPSGQGGQSRGSLQRVPGGQGIGLEGPMGSRGRPTGF